MTEKTRIQSSNVTVMQRSFLSAIFLVSKGLSIAIAATQFALASPQPGIAMAGDPALPPGFTSLPHANPDAPVNALESERAPLEDWATFVE